MKVANILTFFTAAFGITSVLAAPIKTVDVQVREATFTGLNPVQSAYARAIIAQSNQETLGKQGCLAGITTALTESTMRVLANNQVPPSLKYKNDGLGADQDSIGIFQQRASIYTNIECNMNAKCSASQFFRDMKAVNGWQTMEVGKLCQAVQRSAIPDAYDRHVPQARQICSAAGM